MNEQSIIKTVLGRMIDRCRPPAVLYRLQFNKEFRFPDAVACLDWLQELGVETIYCSPFLKAVPGSPHGYNVIDPHSINPEIGDEAEYRLFCDALRERGLDQLLDVVPNHMGVHSDNQPWMDVLTNGPSSRYASFFDIDWNPVKEELRNKLLLPILGDQFGRVLENGEIRLSYEGGTFSLYYFEMRLPVNPRSYALILGERLPLLAERIEADHPDLLRLQSVITAFHNLPPPTARYEAAIEERYRESWVGRERLDALYHASAPVREHIDGLVVFFNGREGEPASFDPLEKLLLCQCYRLAYWQVAGEEINYRRFFDVNELAAIRCEDDEVFAWYHALILRLAGEGLVRGLRIDHSDGLYNPAKYFRDLQCAYLAEMARKTPHAAQEDVPDEDAASIRRAADGALSRDRLPLYVVIEKILDRKESLPEDWLVHGTVGYDFLNMLNRLFIVREQADRFERIYSRFTGMHSDYESLLSGKKRLFAKVQMSGEINVLANLLSRIAEHNRYFRDFTRNNLRTAIRELIAVFPVYRTYIGPDDDTVSERDKNYIHIATEKANSANPLVSASLFDYIRDILLLRVEDGISPAERELRRDFIMRFQQITSPVMAKGVEDTAFYIGNRFISLNEVGGDPAYFGCSSAEFHRHNQDRLRHWPYGLVTTSTHDTKRSEDVRMRLDVLSEMPQDWQTAIVRWSRLNRKYRTQTGRGMFPDRNTEYFLYQTLIGVWPDYPLEPAGREAFIERIRRYAEKAAREAKVHTSWVQPDSVYETALGSFIGKILGPRNAHFLRLLGELHHPVSVCGKYNSLSAIVFKTGVPGVMDNYQGTGLWDYSLVDPDNRRPVDFDLRRHLLARVRALAASGRAVEDWTRELLVEKRDSRIKVFAYWRGLNYRSTQPELFLDGEYLPLEVQGVRENHVIAFARRYGDRIVLAAAGRFFHLLREGRDILPIGEACWGDTMVLLPPEWEGLRLIDIYSGAAPEIRLGPEGPRIAVADLFRYFPFAMAGNAPWRERREVPL